MHQKTLNLGKKIAKKVTYNVRQEQEKLKNTMRFESGFNKPAKITNYSYKFGRI